MPTPSVGIIVFKDADVLLVRNEEASGYSDRVYSLPGGRLEPGESLIAAAVRELQEETGLKTREEDLVEFPDNIYTAKIKNRKDPNDVNTEYFWQVFLCKNYSGNLKASTETTPLWVKIETMDNYYLLPNVKQATLQALNFLKKH